MSPSLSQSLLSSPKMLNNITLLSSFSTCCIISLLSLSIMWLLDGTWDTWVPVDICLVQLRLFFVALLIQISQQPLKLTVLPPLNYRQNHLSISCISRSNFFVMILGLQKCLNWPNCYAAFMLCKLDEILSRKC